MVSPSNPEQEGVKGVMHDGMEDAGHEAQFAHANGGGEHESKSEDKDEDRDEEKDEKGEKDEDEE